MNGIIRYSAPVNTLSDWIDNFFADTGFESPNRQLAKGTWPRVDVSEDEENYRLHADLPGMDKKDINIRIENGVLYMEGEKKEEVKREKGRYTHLERNFGKFSRSFTLPEEIDQERIEGKMENGVLELVLPKNEKAKPKKLQIKIN
ncbi:Heat shock protein Hsp20 [Chitinispirillum alkaliphilum]|nr:Heat shock protein Hsp20 [Chitinispirillum alkaliphilum]